MSFTIPGGTEKGVPVEQASPQTRAYWADRIARSLSAGTSRNPERDRQLLSALKGAQAVGDAPRTHRAQAGSSAASEPHGQTIARVSHEALARVSGTFDTAAAANAAFIQAAQMGHLITPQSVVGQLPMGCAVSTSVVWVDVDKETYPLPGGQALDKVALTRISDALGLDWVESYRTDDRSDPHYCAWHVKAALRRFDGTLRHETGNVDIDARDGSEYALETDARALQNKKPNTELPMTRKFLVRHCESKAMNRAIRRAAALRSKYSREELQKPFIVVSLVLTGRVPDNPGMERVFAERIADSFHGAREHLYTQRALPVHARSGHAPPALPPNDYVDMDDGLDDDLDEGDDLDDHGLGPDDADDLRT